MRKYKLSILAMFKNESTILKSWLEHYIKEGIEHFYLIDNGSTDNYDKILNNYKNKIDLIIDSKRYECNNDIGTQNILYNEYYLKKVKNETEWLFVCDIDEYLFNQNHDKTIYDFIKLNNDYDVFIIKWIFFGTTYVNTPDNLPLSLTYRQELDNNNYYKCLSKTENILTLSIHLHKYIENTKIKKLNFNDDLLLNHYQIISNDYFYNIRCIRGGGVHGTDNLKYKHNYFENNYNWIKIEDNTLKNKKLKIINNKNMLIEYGTKNNKINVTNKFKNIDIIPKSDIERYNIIKIDPCPNILKSIFINNQEFNIHHEIIINKNDNIIYSSITNPYRFKLLKIHRELIFEGNLNQEFPEQLLSVQYIDPNSKVLEIGANIGRNTCVIAKILNNSANLTTIETIPKTIKILKKNRDNNNLKFKIVEGALSKTPLIQKEWNCIPKPDGKIPLGYVEVKTFLYSQIKNNYDTLVLDCEGAFYYICVDFPEILNGVNIVIIENDFINIEHKTYVDNLLNKNGLKSIYKQSGGWGYFKNNFYEVFKRC